MILLKVGFYFFFCSVSFFLTEKTEIKKWKVYDFLLFSCYLIFLFYLLEETYSYAFILLLSGGLWITKLLTEELLKSKNWKKKKAVVVIKNGVLNFKELTKLSYSFDQLMSDLQKIGIQNVDEVGFAILKDKKLMCIKK